MTKRSDFVSRLRQLADTIEASDLPDESTVNVDIGVHWINDRSVLRQWAQIADDAAARSRNGTHWVESKICGFELHIYYEAGLLGATREDQSDLAGLLRGEEREESLV